jgi:hypothetical protein
MKTSRLALPFPPIVALIAYVDGGFNLITVWNCLPVAAGFCALAVGLRVRGTLGLGLITFSVLATLIPALCHLAGLFHWGGRGTNPLGFVMVPVFAILPALVIAVIAFVLVASFCRSDRSDLRKE